MAFLRLLYRKRKILLMLLFMCLFWVVFLYLSMPPAAGFKKKAVERDKISRTRITVTQVMLKTDGSNHNSLQDLNSETHFSSRKHGQNLEDTRKTRPVIDHVAPLLPPKSVNGSINISSIMHVVINRTSSSHSKGGGEKDKPLAKIGHVDQMLKFGAQMKNKTLQKLSDFGIIAKPKTSIVKQIDRHSILNITMSDDEFLFVIQTLIKEAELKSSKMQNRTIPAVTNVDNVNSVNRTGHKNSTDLCDCYTSECICCARLQLTKLHVDRKACANFTYVPKSQEMSFNFLLDGKVHFTETVSAEQPPKICLGSMLKAVGICVDFYNMSFKVNIHDEHKTQLSGCLNFGFNIYNKTISMFPLGCFQIPSSLHQDQRQHQIPLLGNWVP